MTLNSQEMQAVTPDRGWRNEKSKREWGEWEIAWRGKSAQAANPEYGPNTCIV